MQNSLEKSQQNPRFVGQCLFHCTGPPWNQQPAWKSAWSSLKMRVYHEQKQSIYPLHRCGKWPIYRWITYGKWWLSTSMSACPQVTNKTWYGDITSAIESQHIPCSLSSRASPSLPRQESRGAKGAALFQLSQQSGAAAHWLSVVVLCP